MSEKKPHDPLRKLAKKMNNRIGAILRNEPFTNKPLEAITEYIFSKLREAQDLAVRTERERMRKIIGWEGTNDLDNYEQGLCACCDKPYTHYDEGREVYTCDKCGLDKFIEEEPGDE